MSLTGRRVKIIGDSWVAGPAGANLVAALEAQGATVVRDGIVGAGVISTMARLRDVLNEVQGFDTVVFLMGVNDSPGTRVRDNYAALATAMRAAVPHVYILSNATISNPDLPYRHRVRIVEIYQRDAFGDHALALDSSADDAWFNSSNYHLTDDGAAAWVARITPQVVALLDTSSLAGLGRALLATIPGGVASFARI